MKSDLPVLGVCLGAQILAAALGAKVDRNPNGKEIGWHPIRLGDSAKEDRLMRDLPATMTPFHWHGDIFDLPPGAVSLASSDKTPCQAFRHGDKTYGFQFHFEVTQEGVAAMAAAFAKELVRENIPADRMIAQADEFIPRADNNLRTPSSPAGHPQSKACPKRATESKETGSPSRAGRG